MVVGSLTKVGSPGKLVIFENMVRKRDRVGAYEVALQIGLNEDVSW